MAKGSRHGLLPFAFQVEILKRFMSEKELSKLLEDYKGASYRSRGVTKPTDVDKRLVKTFKELGSISKTAETAKVSISKVYSALSRCSYYEA